MQAMTARRAGRAVILSALLALACLVMAAAPARAGTGPAGRGDDDSLLCELLPRLEPSHRLRATLLSREVVEGRLVRSGPDTLWLQPIAPKGEPGVGGAVVAVPLGDIVRLAQRRSGSDRGALVGAGSGATVGGLVGLLVGLWGASWNTDDSDIPIVVGCTALGAAAFGAAGSLIGAGLGATSGNWYVIWPDDRTARELRAERAQARADSLAAASEPVLTRILVEAGYAATGGPYHVTGAAIGLGLLGQPDPRLELGPVMRFHALGGLTDVRPTSASGVQTRLEPIMSLSLDGRLAREDAGWRPWVQGGLGLSLASELYPSAHLGLGLRHRDARGRDWGFVVDRHFMLSDVPDAAHGQWTASLGFSFAP